VQVIAETARRFGQVDDITVVKIKRTALGAEQSHISMEVVAGV
jgi:hypothetical protein